MYKSLINLRLENPQIGRGWYCYREALNDKTVTYTREQPDLKTGFLVMINMKEESLDLNGVSEDFMKNWDIDMNCDNLKLWDNDSSCMSLSSQGFMIFEYDIPKVENRYQHQKNGDECYVSREVRVSGGIEYKV